MEEVKLPLLTEDTITCMELLKRLITTLVELVMCSVSFRGHHKVGHGENILVTLALRSLRQESRNLGVSLNYSREKSEKGERGMVQCCRA